jgi:hypothetical protein
MPDLEWPKLAHSYNRLKPGSVRIEWQKRYKSFLTEKLARAETRTIPPFPAAICRVRCVVTHSASGTGDVAPTGLSDMHSQIHPDLRAAGARTRHFASRFVRWRPTSSNRVIGERLWEPGTNLEFNQDSIACGGDGGNLI